MQALKSSYLESEKNKGEIDVNNLMLWGLLLCAGDLKLKARVLYDILQDNMQETISATDKDFPESFGKLIELATKFPYEMQPQFDLQMDKKDVSKINEDLYDELKENFLDIVFDVAPKLSKKDYQELIIKKAPWLFNPKEIRAHVDKKIGA